MITRALHQRTTLEEHHAARFRYEAQAAAVALSYNETRSPRIFGRTAKVAADMSNWPRPEFVVAIVQNDTGVYAGYVKRPPVNELRHYPGVR